MTFNQEKRSDIRYGYVKTIIYEDDFKDEAGFVIQSL